MAGEPLIVWAVHDFEAENPDEVSFRAGEKIVVVEKDDAYSDGWWQGTNERDETGLFPFSYTSYNRPPSAASGGDAGQGHLGVNGADGSGSRLMNKVSGVGLSSVPTVSVVNEDDEEEEYEPAQEAPDGSNGEDHNPGAAAGAFMNETMSEIQAAINSLAVDGAQSPSKADANVDEAQDSAPRRTSFQSSRSVDPYGSDGETAEGDGDGAYDASHQAAARQALAVAAKDSLAAKMQLEREEAERRRQEVHSAVEAEAREAERERLMREREAQHLRDLAAAKEKKGKEKSQRKEKIGYTPTGAGRRLAPPVAGLQFSDESEGESEGEPFVDNIETHSPLFAVMASKQEQGQGSTTEGGRQAEEATSQPRIQLEKAGGGGGDGEEPQEELVTPLDELAANPEGFNEREQAKSLSSAELDNQLDTKPSTPKAIVSGADQTGQLQPNPVTAKSATPDTEYTRTPDSPEPVTAPLAPEDYQDLEGSQQAKADIGRWPSSASKTDFTGATTPTVGSKNDPIALGFQQAPAVETTPPPRSMTPQSVTSSRIDSGLSAAGGAPSTAPTTANFSATPAAPSTPLDNKLTSPEEAKSPAAEAAAAKEPLPRDPRDWSVEQVVEWGRSKGWDQKTVLDKFIEHEISGDVLLEMDINILKEIDIIAFGKRSKIATAIHQLRRPLSVSSGQAASFGLATPQTVPPRRSSSPFQPPTQVPLSPHSPKSSVGASYDADQDHPPSRPPAVADTLAPIPGLYQNQPRQSYRNSSSDLQGLAASPPIISSESFNRVVRRMSDPDIVGDTRTSRDGRGARVSLLGSEGGQSRPQSIVVPDFAGGEGLFAAGVNGFGAHRRSYTNTDNVSFGPPSAGSRKTSSKFDEVTSGDEGGLNAGAKLRVPRKSASSSNTKSGSGDRTSIFAATFGRARKPPPKYTPTSADSAPEKPTERPTKDITASEGKRALSKLGWGSKRGTKVLTGQFDIHGRPLISLPISSPDFDPAHKLHAIDTSPATGEHKGMRSQDETMGMQNNPGATALERLGTPDLAGWMRKKGEKYNTWKLRFFVLKGPYLYYLRNEQETKIKGFIDMSGYKVIADQNIAAGKYGFKILHVEEKPHYFCSEDGTVVREWMKALMKATIGRDTSVPVVSSCTIDTMPLEVAQAMHPPPRPPSPTTRARVQRERAREHHSLTAKDAHVLMAFQHAPPESPSSERRVSQVGVTPSGRRPLNSGTPMRSGSLPLSMGSPDQIARQVDAGLGIRRDGTGRPATADSEKTYEGPPTPIKKPKAARRKKPAA